MDIFQMFILSVQITGQKDLTIFVKGSAINRQGLHDFGGRLGEKLKILEGNDR
jgi:hypothetical protein